MWTRKGGDMQLKLHMPNIEDPVVALDMFFVGEEPSELYSKGDGSSCNIVK